jgi:PAS domain S-box-containing protein
MENELSRAVDALPGLVWTARPDGESDFLNQRWCDYTGLSFDEALGTGWLAAIHPDDLTDLLQRWQAMIDTGQGGEVEARLRRHDGAYRWFLFSTAPLRGASGQVVKWCGINTDIDDRRQAEARLRTHERRFETVVDGLPALVTLMRPDGQIEHANRHVLDYFGMSLEALNRREAGGTFHPDDWPGVLAAWRLSLETGEPYDFEARNGGADGVYRWFHIRGFPLRDPDGGIYLWYFLQTDIDARKHAEALLIGENRLLEMVALGRPVPIVLEAICRLVEETIAGCHCGILLIDPSGATFQRGVAPTLPDSYGKAKAGRPVRPENGPCGMAASLRTQVIVPDVASEARWDAVGWRDLALAHDLRSCWSTPILSLTGEPLGTFAIYQHTVGEPAPLDQALMQKFTHVASIAIERMRSEDALKRSEAFLAETRRLSSTGGVFKRMATGEITWSDEVYRMYDFEPGTPVTLERIMTRIHPEDAHAFEDMLEAQQRGSNYQYEYRLLMPDQSIRHLHVVGHASRDQDGQLEYIAAVQDVTPRRRSEEALDRARSELARVTRVMSLGALTASIAHEVNQPLSGIITNASTCLRMLAAEPPNVAGALETARRTIRDGNRAADVITRLRALFGRKGLATETVDLNEAAREVIALSWSDLQRRRVVLRSELADDLPPIRGDRVQLQQVILNLLLNAVDAMSGVDDRPRLLWVRTERDGEARVRLTVQDAGAGFEPQDAERLFEAFYTTKNGGMGIGLSVSRSIVEGHHGHLWAASNDGPGATFAFSIPCGLEAGAELPTATDPRHIMRDA